MEKMIETKLGRCSITREEDGSFTSFNHDHYRKVRRAKTDKEIKDALYNGHENGFIRDDTEYAPTMGTGKKYVLNGETYYIQAAHKHWQRGYYIMLLTYTIMDNGHFSHATVWKENINSKEEEVIKSVEEYKDVVFEESSLQEKIDIIISNRKKLNLPTIIHINRFDAENIETIDVTKSENIQDLIKKHVDSKEPLLLSGGMSWVEVEYTNFNMDVISVEGEIYKAYDDIIYFHRSYEE